MYLDILPPLLAAAINACGDLEEIRLRAGRPVCVRKENREFGVAPEGTVRRGGMTFTAEDAASLWRRLCDHSPYAMTQCQQQGYFTLPGGHRVGFAGETDQQYNLRRPTFFCIRIAHQVKGCALDAYRLLFDEWKPLSTAFVGPPGSGKTTYLRDCIRLASADGFNVCVADERNELSAAQDGIPALDLGRRTDVYTGCPKAVAMRNMVRSMRPDILAADELGTQEDLIAAREASSCGVALYCSFHGETPADVLRRGIRFERYVLLREKSVEGVFDGVGTLLQGRSVC